MYIVGLDLGQAQDYSALIIVDRQQPPNNGAVLGHKASPATYAVRYIKRWQLGTPYPTIVTEVAALLTHPPLVGASRLLIDHTGCGRPVLDMFTKDGLRPVGVSIHGGDRVSQDGLDYRVPKRDLVGVVAVLLQQARLQIAKNLPETPMLLHELLNFKVKIDPTTAHDSYSAWREQDHDDLVLALALACWWGEFRGERRAGIVPIRW